MSLEKFITKVLNVKADGIQKMTSIEEENSSLTKALAQAKESPVSRLWRSCSDSWLLLP
ncbi:MAG: hypothetical protein KHX20_10530 [Megasphaera sp.]|nr:hypothetical protein [Megasphaera sp.]